MTLRKNRASAGASINETVRQRLDRQTTGENSYELLEKNFATHFL
jgi:hypothetical protein